MHDEIPAVYALHHCGVLVQRVVVPVFASFVLSAFTPHPINGPSKQHQHTESLSSQLKRILHLPTPLPHRLEQIAMTKLWCPLCKTPFPAQDSINTHLLHTHNHKVTSHTEHLYRQMQDRKWGARGEMLDPRLRQHVRERRLEWESFARNSKEKDVPTTSMDEGLAREMVVLNEVDDDSEVEEEPVDWEREDEDTTDGVMKARGHASERGHHVAKVNAVAEKNSQQPPSTREKFRQHLADFQTELDAQDEKANDADDEMEAESQRSWREEDEDP